MSFPLDWWFSTSSSGLGALLYKIFMLSHYRLAFLKLSIQVPAPLQVCRPQAENHWLGQLICRALQSCTLYFHHSPVHGWQGFENLMNFSDFMSGIQASSQVFGTQVRRKHHISLLFHSKRTVFISKDLYQRNCLPKSPVHYCSHPEDVRHLR